MVSILFLQIYIINIIISDVLGEKIGSIRYFKTSVGTKKTYFNNNNDNILIFIQIILCYIISYGFNID